MSEDFSPSDMMAMMNNGNYGANGMWDNPFMYLIWLAIFGNGGFGGWGNNSAAAAAANGALTRAEMTDGFAAQNLQSDVRSTQSDINNGFDRIAQSLCNGFAGVNSSITNSIFANTQAVHDLQSADQLGFCGVNNSINNLKYEIAQNCCDLKTAMHSEGETTRALITQNTIQDFRDKLAEKDNTLHAANLTLANVNQTQNILSSMGRYVPYSGCGTNCPNAGF